jgi:N utilization substance protein A
VAVEIDEEERIASVTVPERMLSLAIGREGQNARLAAKLTGWRIDIRSETGTAPEDGEGGSSAVVAEPDEPEADVADEAAPAAEAEAEAPAQAEETPDETSEEPVSEEPTDEEPDVDEAAAEDAAATESTEVTQ